KRSTPDALQFSPDGRYLAIQAFGRVDLLDTHTGKTRQVCAGHNTKYGTAGVGFTADSRGMVYFKISDQSVHVFDLHTRADRVLRHSHQVPWDFRGDVGI